MCEGSSGQTCHFHHTCSVTVLTKTQGRTQEDRQEGNFGELTIYWQDLQQWKVKSDSVKRELAIRGDDGELSFKPKPREVFIRMGRGGDLQTKERRHGHKCNKLQETNGWNTQFPTGTDIKIWHQAAGEGCFKGLPTTQISCWCGGSQNRGVTHAP